MDFSAPHMLIIFAEGDHRKPFPISITNDFVCEGNEKIDLLIMTPGDFSGIIPENSTTSITILEDDRKNKILVPLFYILFCV